MVITILQDIRFAARRLASRPAFTALTILMLGLGIGATTAVLTIVDQTIFRPVPFAHAERLVDVAGITATGGGGSILTPEKIIEWQSQPVFDAFEGHAGAIYDLTGDGEPERIFGRVVTTGLFPMLGAAPQVGRGFSAEDGAAGSERVVIISDGLWRRRFGGDRSAIGRMLTLSDRPHRIVGVMPRRFQVGSTGDSLWVALNVRNPGAEGTRGGFMGVGRLAAGSTLDAVQARVDVVAEQLQAAKPHPQTWGLRLLPMRIAFVDEAAKRSLLILLGAVMLVLLIACANVAHLFLVQASRRAREVALRCALGASRARLAREVMCESVLLAAGGGVAGVLLALWGVDAAVAAAPGSMTFLESPTIEIDLRVLAFTAIIALTTALLFGLVPAIRGSRPNVNDSMRGGNRDSIGSGAAGRLPAALVVAEVALALMLLVGAGLMTRTFVKLNALAPGFEPRGLITLQLSIPTDRYPSPYARSQFFDQVTASLNGIEGISGATTALGALPSEGGFSWGVEADGSAAGVDQSLTIGQNTVGNRYFETLRLPIVAGRTFTTGDPNEVIVSRSLANHFWPGRSPLGERLRTGARNPWQTVVGVAGDVEGRVHEERNPLQMYFPYVTPPVPAVPPAPVARRTYVARHVIVRADDATAALPAIRTAIRTLDRDQPIERVALGEDLYADTFDRERFVLLLMTIFSSAAVLLAAAGIFGVLSESVTQRTREIGVRIALGAEPRDVSRMFVARGLRLAGLGVLIGAAGAAALSGVLNSLLFGVSPHDPVSYAAVGGGLMGVALLASWLPTRRAMRIEPAAALRTE